MTDLTIVYRNPSEVRPEPRNARTHPKRQLDQIAASITAFGFTNPILIDADGVIIAGHGRLLAAKRLQLSTIPTITLGHLSLEQRRGLRLADNKIALNAGWDSDLLRLELADLTSLDLSFDAEALGFSAGELEVVLAADSRPDPEDEVIPAAPAEPRTRPGDIWRLGVHRIGCGDARDSVFLRQVMGESVLADVAFLDVPYNVSIAGHANVRSRHREFAMASGEMDRDEFTTFLRQGLGACAQVSRDGAVHFVCIDWRHQGELARAGDAVYGELLNLCVWNKSNAGMGALYRSKHELIYVYRVGRAAHFNAVELGRHGRNRTNVWDYASVNSLRGDRRQDLDLHPTVKPVAMVAEALKDVSRRGEVVLDAFLGSGTTLVAAERTGRRCRAVEIDPGYVDVALQRWTAMTGQEPELEVGGVGRTEAA